MQATSSFINRYKTAFGRSNALILKLTNLVTSEHKAHGAWIESADGKKWLDFGSFGINLLGHTHPHIVEAATEQMKKMGLSSKILGSEIVLQAAERLLDTTQGAFDGLIFGNTGSEVVELALRVAVLSTHRKKILAFERSYHGKSLGALSVSDSLQKYKSELGGYDVEFIPINDCTRLQQLLESRTIAAVIIEPVQGEGGIRPVENIFLNEVVELADRYGTISIFDEIQTGLGRCGLIWRHLILKKAPDIILSGKALAGGIMPVSAMIYNRRKVSKIADDPLISASTFSSSPLAGAVVKATTEVIEHSNILKKVEDISAYCFNYLNAALQESTVVVEIRGEGLMMGIELINSQVAGDVIFEATKRGLLITFCLIRSNVIRFYPPAVISTEDVETGLMMMAEAILTVEHKYLV